MHQKLFRGMDYLQYIHQALIEVQSKRPMLICGKHVLHRQDLVDFINYSSYAFTVFTDFQPNPDYASAIEAAKIVQKQKCDFILAIGGGSAIDVAKCARRFSTMNLNADCLSQQCKENTVKFLAIPTTAGSGSEATHFAVLYRNDKKYSVSGNDMLPDYVILNPDFLHGLPLYQKKSCYLDALCQAVESWWAKRANEESIGYSKKTIALLLDHYEEYFSEHNTADTDILLGAHYAGKAINITTTTAAHAMSYGLTKRFGLAHGHAVAVCLIPVWKHLLSADNANLNFILDHIAESFNCTTKEEALKKFAFLVNNLEMQKTISFTDEDLEWLASSVNVQRLINHPQPLTYKELYVMYKQILAKD